MNTPPVVTPLAVIAVSGLTWAALLTSTLKAQAQQNAAGTDVSTSLRAKVERLEKQVQSLKGQVAQLQRRSATGSSSPAVKVSPSAPQRAAPQRGTSRVQPKRRRVVRPSSAISQRGTNGDLRSPRSFVFNGITVYIIPLSSP
jgi:hypothetical protein